MIIERYMVRALVLNMFFTILIVAALVAGPAIRKTSAAPGFKPLSISAAAIGVEDVAQTYMGIPAKSIISIDKNWCSFARVVISSGKKKVMIPAIKIPTIKGLEISDNNSPKAYLRPSPNFLDNFS